ncbi:hypothetical protein C7U60_11535 [Mesorhizobium plurifarium]|nr:hypothetical protein C7U60_11535 [Mesorhizobium plurifarium]
MFLLKDSDFYLIPVLCHRDQVARVCGAGEPSRPRGLGRLHSCDKHRNAGQRNVGAFQSTRYIFLCQSSSPT